MNNFTASLDDWTIVIKLTRLPNFFLSWLIVTVASLSSIQAADDPYIITQYTDEHGLPQNSIKGIGQDNLGFIWLISEKGPIRYDGNGRFKTTDSLSTSLKSVRMTALYRGTHRGELLARGEYGETVLLKNGKATLLQGADDLVSKLSLRYTRNTYFNFLLPSPYARYEADYVFLPDGTAGAFRISQDSISHIPKGGTPASALYFPNGDFWHFASHYGKLIYFGQTREYIEIDSNLRAEKKKIMGDFLQLPSNTSFNIFWNAASDQLFLYAAKTLYRLTATDTGNLCSTLLISGFDFDKNDIISVHYLEKQDQLLLGSATKGLFVIKKRIFRSLQADTDDSENISYNQTRLPNGLLVTNNGIAFDQQGRFHRSAPLQREGLQHGQIIGPDGNLWILGHDSILVVSTDLNRIVEKKLFPAYPRVAFRDAAGTYWIGGGKGKLLRYDEGSDTFRTEASFRSIITYLERKGDQELFVSTIDGLFVFNIANRVWKEISFFNGKQVRSIRNESDRRYWITTYQHGFYLYEDGQITAFPLDKTMYLATSHCTLEDQNGFIWISTNKGLFRVSKQQLLDYRTDPQKNPFYLYYDKQWGFSTNEFNGGCQPCALELPTGEFSFPSLQGLVQFDPLAVPYEFPTGHIVLDNVLLDGASIPIKDTIRIPNHFSRLDITVTTPFYGNAHNVQIEYLLSGTNDRLGNWLPMNPAQNTLSVNKLASGIQKINIRIRSGINSGDFHHATFYFYVEPLFYETWWFMVLTFIGLCAIIWLIVYSRTQFVLRQNRWLLQKINERTEDVKKQYEWQQRLSASITHDIRTPLNYLVKTLFAMQSTAKTKAVASHEIEQVYHATQHIYHYSNNLTKLARVMLTKAGIGLNEVSLYEIIQQQIHIFHSIARSCGNVIRNQVPRDTMVLAHADILSVIVHNVLDNAVKFTRNGEISIYIELKNTEVTSFNISDTGIGLHPDQTAYFNAPRHAGHKTDYDGGKQGLGLMLAKDMADLIQAEMLIHSLLGKGTTVTFILHEHHAGGTNQSIP